MSEPTEPELSLRMVESFRKHVRQLLLDGKRSQHEDFQLLFRIFGKDKVVEIAKEELARMKDANST